MAYVVIAMAGLVVCFVVWVVYDDLAVSRPAFEKRCAEYGRVAEFHRDDRYCVDPKSGQMFKVQ